MSRRLGLALVVSVALVSGAVGAVAAPPGGGVALGGAVFAAPASTRTEVAGKVIFIADGDTVHVRDALGSRVKVRVLGINSPEDRNPQLPAQCWGPEATQFARTTLLNKQVTVVSDPTQDAFDRYGRVLGYVYLADGSNYSVLAARAGAARTYVFHRRPVTEYPAIAAAEAEARAAGRGLWGACPA
ncbi:thermonuclease family protein [Pseudonocardia sp. CA-142604]|uniref:thermonuclease family protein n=1 Tax=Pseudonocardia sp. CA-142604 TaxID=3240024 RepID=UPI003D91160B